MQGSWLKIELDEDDFVLFFLGQNLFILNI